MREGWIKLRNRLLASGGFQRFAMRFPLTRPIARRRARDLFDLTAGFVYAQVLAACVELGLLDLLAERPLTVADIAARLDLPQYSARRLLVAAEALRLVETVAGDRYALGSEGAALRGNPGVAEMVRHHHLLYADLADPVALLRRSGGEGALAAHWPYAGGAAGDAGGPTGEVGPYSALMAASQPMIAGQVLDAYPFRRHRRLLDVGGGEGAFLEAVAARHPGLALSLFDLPAVADRARSRLGGKADVVAGSFLADPLPNGADLITLVRILHDHDDDVAAAILARCADALAPGGTLLIAEPMAGTRGAERVGAYFSFYLLAMGSGRPRTAREIGALLEAAGFAQWREHRTAAPLLARIITATRG